MGHATHSSREQSGGRDFTRIDFVRLLKAQTRRGQCELRVCESGYVCVCGKCKCRAEFCANKWKASAKAMKIKSYDALTAAVKRLNLPLLRVPAWALPFTMPLSLYLPPFLYVTLYVTPSLCVSPLQVTIFVAYIRACFIIFYHLLGKLCSRKTTTTNNNNWLLLLMQNVFQLNVPTPAPSALRVVNSNEMRARAGHVIHANMANKNYNS